MGYPTPQLSHGENSPHWNGLPRQADRVTHPGGVPHLTCEYDQEKRRNCMDRLVTPPRQGTSPAWGTPLPCEQVLHRLFNIFDTEHLCTSQLNPRPPRPRTDRSIWQRPSSNHTKASSPWGKSWNRIPHPLGTNCKGLKKQPTINKQNKTKRIDQEQNIPDFNTAIIFWTKLAGDYRKDLCISRTFLLKFWAKNRGCGLYTRPLLSDRVNWLVVVTNWLKTFGK